MKANKNESTEKSFENMTEEEKKEYCEKIGREYYKSIYLDSTIF